MQWSTTFVREPVDDQLACEVGPDRDRVILRPVGELDLVNADGLRELMIAYADLGFARILIDLSGLTFIDGRGMCMVLAVARELPGRLTIAPGPPAVQRAFTVAGLVDLLPFEPRPISAY